MRKFFLAVIICLAFSSMAHSQDQSTDPASGAGGLEKATFAGGCFWCMEPPFEKLKGVKSVISGYTGGTKDSPTYEDVCSGTTGHAESVQVTYDPAQVSYAELLEVFWQNINPTTPNQQFADIGTQYRSAIFYHNEEQKRLAEASKMAVNESGCFDRPVVTEITPASRFYPAEDYHQDYYKKNPTHYKMYRYGSGREPYLKKIWGDGSCRLKKFDTKP